MPELSIECLVLESFSSVWAWGKLLLGSATMPSGLTICCQHFLRNLHFFMSAFQLSHIKSPLRLLHTRFLVGLWGSLTLCLCFSLFSSLQRDADSTLQIHSPSPMPYNWWQCLVKAQTDSCLPLETLEHVDNMTLGGRCVLHCVPCALRERQSHIIRKFNVCFSHGNKEVFSCRGIKLAVDWFLERGHKDVTVFVPAWRKEQSRPDALITGKLCSAFTGLWGALFNVSGYWANC